VQAVEAGQAGKGTVLVVGAGNKLESRSVGIGLQSASELEITSGLQENESIVYGSVQQFRPGEVVMPKQVEPAHMD
jgi:multidrug efflux pump subunit AcrA (membrane-fusion protein)